MKKEKLFKNACQTIFLIGLLALFIFIDTSLAKEDPIGKSELFKRNDFENAKLRHSEEVYDKVFYGNSVVAGAFLEEESRSDYINMGFVYGTVEDLSKILDKKMIKVGSELVIGMNYLTFMDTLDTNPTYLWHRKAYEPYLYFHRDRLYPLITEGIQNVLDGEEFVSERDTRIKPYLSYGMLSDEEMDKIVKSHGEKHWSKDLSNYEKNFESLQWVIDYCKQENIKLRFIWFPWNPYVDKPLNVKLVEEEVNKILDRNNAEYIDLSDSYPREYFWDIGHLNAEKGAKIFTKEIDKWLVK